MQQCAAAPKVLLPRGAPAAKRPGANTREGLTVVCMGSATGAVLPPVYILKGVVANANLVAALNYRASAFIFKDTTHFIDGATFAKVVEYWSHLIPGGVSPQRRALLVVDGHASRFSHEAKEVGRRLGFDILVLPPNCTHFLQPWDQVFAPSSRRTARCSRARARSWAAPPTCRARAG